MTKHSQITENLVRDLALSQTSDLAINRLADLDRASIEPLQNHAEELMESLFAGVEQTLDIKISSHGISSQGSESKYLDGDNPNQDENLALVHTFNPDLDRNFNHTKNLFAQSSKLVIIPKNNPPQPKRPKTEANKPTNQSDSKNKPAAPSEAPQSVGFIDSLLLGCALTSAIFAVVLGLINAKISNSQLAQTANPQSDSRSIAKLDSKLDQSAEVAEKLQRSLAEIQPKNDPGLTTTRQLADPVKINDSTKNDPIKIIDIPPADKVKPIFIPIYQSPPNATNAPIKPISPVAAAKEIPKEPTKEAAQNVPVKKPSNFTLIGVLDLGEKSSAIFDTNGTIQSVKIGGNLGDSGWIVSRISQQEVTLKKGKENAAVSVGQKF